MLDLIAEAKGSGFADIDEAALEHLRQGVTTFSEIRPLLSVPHSYDGGSALSGRQSASQRAVTGEGEVERFTIMLVEDDLQNRKTIAHHLRRKHFRVLEMENGIAALKRLTKRIYPRPSNHGARVTWYRW